MRATRLLSRLAAALGFSTLRVEALRLQEAGPILFAGDSTLRYQYELFCPSKDSIQRKHGHWVCQAKEGYDVFFIDYQKSDKEYVRAGPDGATLRLKKLTGITPQVVYLNFYGLWTLHLEPFVAWDNWAARRLGYTAQHLQESMQRTLSMGVEAVVLMTTHHVCEEKFTDNWRIFLQHGPEAGCSDYRARGCPGLQTEDCGEDAEALCRVSACTGSGARLLAEEELPAYELAKASGARVALVDAHEITEKAGCEHTVDGRHYDTETVEAEVKAFRAALAHVAA